MQIQISPCWIGAPEFRDSISADPRQNPFMKPARFLGLAALALTGCGAFKSNKPEKPEKSGESPKSEAPKLVGRIASIPADRRFVLIQSYEKWNVEAGTILTTRGPDARTANLLATGESLGQFAAADLQSGLVEVGDAVYSRHVPKPPQPAESTAPAEPAKETPLELPEDQLKHEFENVQKNN